MSSKLSRDIIFPLLLDGGLSYQLRSQGCELNHPLWTANILLEKPAEIKRAHLAFINAGARCIITSSYQASFTGLAKMGLSSDDIVRVFQQSVAIAQEARSEFTAEQPDSQPIYIAASIGPYGASLADGSEYQGDYEISSQALMDYHMPRFEVLDKSEADWYACETIPSLQEAIALADLLDQSRKSGWITFSCRDEKHISDGTPIAECTSVLADHEGIFALGINCTHPKYVTDLIGEITPYLGDNKLVVYPNSGEVFSAASKEFYGQSTSITDFATDWLDLGVDVLGGCCRIGADTIRDLSRNNLWP